MNELGPVNLQEFLYICSFLIGGVLVSAFAFGDIANLVEELSQKDNK